MHSVLFHIGPITAYSYGMMIAIGVIAAFWMSGYRAKKRGLNDDVMFNMGLVGIVGGIIGAKLLYYITVIPDIIKNPSILWNIQEGFVVYGGLICGFLCPFIYTKIKKYPFWRYLDIAVPAVAVGQGFGRIGCFLAGCCYGKETHGIWGVQFPDNSLAPAGISLIPTQLISSAGDFLIAFILILLSRKEKKAGTLSGIYLILYSVGRFAIEFLRDDPRGTVGVLSTSQFIAIFTCLLGVGIVILALCGYPEKMDAKSKAHTAETQTKASK